MLLAAARELALAEKLPLNVRVVCDGEEETGGQTVVEYVAQDRRGADAAVIFDSSMIRRGLPAFNVATRGIVYFHVRLRTGKCDLHSGIYGGAALNAAHALIHTLDRVIAQDGVLAEQLRRGTIPPTDEELDGWRELPGGADELAGQGARPDDEAAAEQFYRRTFAETALDINGIAVGSPFLEKTVLPVEADANLSIRLAPGQRVEEIAPELERLIHASAPKGTDVSVELLSAAQPGVIDQDSRAIQLSRDAFERVLGRRPALIRMGGTLPIVPALTEKGVPAILTGFGLPDSQIHAPNERLLVSYVPLGIEAAKALFIAYANL